MKFKIVEVSRITRVASFVARGNMAAKRLLKGISDAVVREMKSLHSAYDDTGRLTQSIHSAPPDENHYNDMISAEFDDLDNAEIEDIAVTPQGVFALVAGSWLPYACVEASGRRRDFVNPAIDMVGNSQIPDSLAVEAFKESGM